jgi:hypothetical protein
MEMASAVNDIEMNYNFLYPVSKYYFHQLCAVLEARGGVVVKALRYKPAGRGFDSRWCHWNFSVT